MTETTGAATLTQQAASFAETIRAVLGPPCSDRLNGVVMCVMRTGGVRVTMLLDDNGCVTELLVQCADSSPLPAELGRAMLQAGDAFGAHASFVHGGEWVASFRKGLRAEVSTMTLDRLEGMLSVLLPGASITSFCFRPYVAEGCTSRLSASWRLSWSNSLGAYLLVA